MPSEPLRRVGIVGDVHAEDEALEAALGALDGLGVDAVLAVGDVVDGRGDPDRCCALLRDAGAWAVRGNHERWLLEGVMRELADATTPESLAPATRAWLGALPATRAFETVAGPALLCHGLGEHDMAQFRPDDEGYGLAVNDALHALVRDGEYAFVLGGHTHRRMVRRYRGVTVVNAGTLRRGERPCFAVVDFAAGEVAFFDLGAAGAVAPAERCALPGVDGLVLPAPRR